MQNINIREFYDHNLKIKNRSHNHIIFLDWFVLISFSIINFCLIIDNQIYRFHVVQPEFTGLYYN